MILLDEVSVTYPGGVQALRGASLRIEAGEFVALLGPNGAGKSTLLRVINGLVAPADGVVTVAGQAVRPGRADLRPVRRRVGMVFQHFNLVKRMSVLDNVLCGRLAYLHPLPSALGLFPASDRRLALESLERVGLAEKAYQRADRLSGGQQQRVGIARALVQKPQVILADEPVASLDPVSAKQVMELLTRVNREDGITVVASMHDVDLALRYARRAVGLRDGRIVVDKLVTDLTPADLAAIYQATPAPVGRTDAVLSLAEAGLEAAGALEAAHG